MIESAVELGLQQEGFIMPGILPEPGFEQLKRATKITLMYRSVGGDEPKVLSFVGTRRVDEFEEEF